MARPKRNQTQIAADRMFAEKLHLRRLPHHEIAQKLTELRAGQYVVSPDMVRYDLKEIVAQWRKVALQDISEARGKDIATLDHLIDEAFKAWDKSKLDAEKQRQKALAPVEVGGAARPVEMTKFKEGQCGDVSYLRLVIECLDRKAKLLGLDAPLKLKGEGFTGQNIVIVKAPYDQEDVTGPAPDATVRDVTPARS